MKNKSIYKLFVLLMLGISVVACDKGGDPDPGTTKVVEMAGDWYVKVLDQSQNVLLGYSRLTTYNTSANEGNNFWIDDNGNIQPFKVKSPVNAKEKTFSGGNLESTVGSDTITVNISDGAILEDAATTPGGNISDSIYFKAEFSDDPGAIYTIAGYKRTGFLEDEN